MDVSGEVADLMAKESLQVAETAAKLAGSGLKNVAALLLALSKDDYKVVGKTNSKRLARDPAPAEVIRLKKEDIPQFEKLAKEYGILYFIAQKKGNESGIVDVVSNQNYAALLNAAMEAMHYPIPEKAAQEESAAKKAPSRAQPERSSPERGSGLNPQRTDTTPEKPSVRGRLAALQAASDGMKSAPVKQKEHTR